MRPDMNDPKVRIAYLEEALYLMEQRSSYFERRAGIPRPCPRCGGPVRLYGWPTDKAEKLFVGCCVCGYVTSQKMQDWQDAWREHEQNCRKAEEDEE